MSARQRIVSAAMAFSMATASMLPPKSAQAQVSPAGNSEIVRRTPQDFTRLCRTTRVRDNDFVGMATQRLHCINATVNDNSADLMVQRADLNIRVARYLHTYTRNGREFPVRGNPDLQPQVNLDYARDRIRDAGTRRADPAQLAVLQQRLQEAQAFISRPPQSRYFDPTPAAACVLDYEPETDDRLQRKLEACAQAYRRAPSGTIAENYADAAHGLAASTFRRLFRAGIREYVNERDWRWQETTQGLQYAFLSLEFRDRALADGYSVNPADLNQSAGTVLVFMRRIDPEFDRFMNRRAADEERRIIRTLLGVAAGIVLFGGLGATGGASVSPGVAAAGARVEAARRAASAMDMAAFEYFARMSRMVPIP